MIQPVHHDNNPLKRLKGISQNYIKFYRNAKHIGDNISIHFFETLIKGEIVVQFLKYLFSSPELKAQVSFSDHLSSVVCLSVRLSVRPSVNFSHFHLLLQNHWANFNQAWHKVSLGEGDSYLFR